MCAFIAEKRPVQYDDSKFIIPDDRKYFLVPIYNIRITYAALFSPLSLAAQ